MRLELDAPIQQRIADAPTGVTAAHCLSHTSGLPPWRALFSTLTNQQRWGLPATRDEALRLARTVPVTAAPGQRYAYSDLGFMLLCALLEDIGGERLPEVQVAPPTTMEGFMGRLQAAVGKWAVNGDPMFVVSATKRR